MGYAKTYQKFNGQSSSKLNCKESGGWVAGKVGGVIKVSIAGNANKCRRLHASPSLINCKTTSQWRLFVCTLYRRVGKKGGGVRWRGWHDSDNFNRFTWPRVCARFHKSV